MDLSDLFKNCRIYTAEQSTVDLLPVKQPAVYAFYDLFRFDHKSLIDDIDKYRTRHGRTIELMKEQLPDQFSIKLRGDPTRFKGEGKRLCESAKPERLPDLCRAIMSLSFLHEPLYIGKTNDIRVRFAAHHDNHFLFKMKDKFKRSPDEFLLLVYQCAEEDARLLESILIQLINPPFCEQKS